MNGGAGLVHKCIRCSWEAPRRERRLRWLQPGFLSTAGTHMHNPTRRHRLAAAALLLLTGVSAQACEIWRDKELGIWRGNCNLKDFLVSQTFIAQPPAPADLQVAGPADPQVQVLRRRLVGRDLRGRREHRHGQRRREPAHRRREHRQSADRHAAGQLRAVHGASRRQCRATPARRVYVATINVAERRRRTGT